MPNPRFTATCLLVDRSGSMTSIQRSAEDGINAFIREQAEAEGLRTLSIAQFDTKFEWVTRAQSGGPKLALPATIEKFQIWPRGVTALLDAMGKAMVQFGVKLAALPEAKRPSNVVFAVMTDGQENASSEYTYDQIKAMVEHQELNYAWQVVYLGANQDAASEASRMGIQRDRAITYAATDHGTRAVTDSLSGIVAAASSGMAFAYTGDDREAAVSQ